MVKNLQTSQNSDCSQLTKKQLEAKVLALEKTVNSLKVRIRDVEGKTEQNAGNIRKNSRGLNNLGDLEEIVANNTRDIVELMDVTGRGKGVCHGFTGECRNPSNFFFYLNHIHVQPVLFSTAATNWRGKKATYFNYRWSLMMKPKK